MQELSWAEWDLKSRYRGVDCKVPELLPPVIEMYENKIPRLQFILEQEREKYAELLKISSATMDDVNKVPEVAILISKIARLQDKLITCQKELQGRDLGTLPRLAKDLHHTLYYIDLDEGNDGSAGTAIGTAWLTIAKYTTTTVRTAGDIAYVRANTSQDSSGSSIIVDESASSKALIQLIGCDSVTNDPWSDGSDVKPFVSFGDTSENFIMSTDSRWGFTRLVFKESTSSFGVFGCYYGGSTKWIDCEFTDHSGGNVSGFKAQISGYMEFENCIFKDNLFYNAWMVRSSAKFVGCAFDGGVTTTNKGLYASENSLLEVIDSAFGGTTEHETVDIEMYQNSRAILRNTTYTITPLVSAYGNNYDGFIGEEDSNGVFGASIIRQNIGTVTKDTTIKTGNATFSSKMEGSSLCGVVNPLTLNNFSSIDFPFNTYLEKDSEYTLTVKIRSLGTWGTYPTAAQLYMETSYLSNGATAARAVDTSTEVISTAEDWVSFTTTFTPLQDGIAYTTVKLGLYEDAGDGCYVNGEITVV